QTVRTCRPRAVDTHFVVAGAERDNLFREDAIASVNSKLTVSWCAWLKLANNHIQRVLLRGSPMNGNNSGLALGCCRDAHEPKLDAGRQFLREICAAPSGALFVRCPRNDFCGGIRFCQRVTGKPQRAGVTRL